MVASSCRVLHELWGEWVRVGRRVYVIILVEVVLTCFRTWTGLSTSLDSVSTCRRLTEMLERPLLHHG